MLIGFTVDPTILVKDASAYQVKSPTEQVAFKAAVCPSQIMVGVLDKPTGAPGISATVILISILLGLSQPVATSIHFTL